VAISEKNIGLADRLPIRQKKSRLCRPIPDPTPIFPNPPILPICRFCRSADFPQSADFADPPILPIPRFCRQNLTALPTEFRPIGKFADADPKMPILPIRNCHPDFDNLPNRHCLLKFGLSVRLPNPDLARERIATSRTRIRAAFVESAVFCPFEIIFFSFQNANIASCLLFRE
jgi:hypothetical protein